MCILWVSIGKGCLEGDAAGYSRPSALDFSSDLYFLCIMAGKGATFQDAGHSEQYHTPTGFGNASSPITTGPTRSTGLSEPDVIRTHNQQITIHQCEPNSD